MNWVLVVLAGIVMFGLVTAWHAQRRAHPLNEILLILLLPIFGPLVYWIGSVIDWGRRAMPQSPVARTARGGLDAALIDVEREAEPGPGTLIKAAEAALRDGRPETAEHYYLQAIAVVSALESMPGGQVPVTWRAALALAQLEQDKATEALQSIRGLPISDNENLAILTARAFEKLDRLEEASAALEPFLTGFSSEEVPYRYAGLLERRGSNTVAMRLYQEIVARADATPDGVERNLTWIRLAVERLNQYDHPSPSRISN